MITRFEIIDWRGCKPCNGTGIAPNRQPCAVCSGLGNAGRQVVTNPNDNDEITYSVQDDGRTLKVFIKKRGDK